MDGNKLLVLGLKLLDFFKQDLRNDNWLSKLVAVFTCFSLLSVSVFGWLELIINFKNHDLKEFAFIMDIIDNYTFLFVLLLTLRWKKPILLKILEIKEFNPLEEVDQNQIERRRSMYKQAYRLILIELMMSTFFVSLIYLGSLIQGKRDLPILVFKLAIFYENPYYHILFYWGFALAIIMPVICIGVYTLFTSFLCFIYFQLIFLSENIKKIVVDKENEKHCFRLLVNYTKIHNDIMKYFQDVNEVFRTILLVHSYNAILNNCFSMFIIATKRIENMESFLQSVLTIFINFSILFFPSVGVTFVVMRAEMLADAVYSIPWYNGSSDRIKHVTIFMIQNAQKKLKFKLILGMELNLEFYMSLLRLTYSAFALMMTIKN